MGRILFFLSLLFSAAPSAFGLINGRRLDGISDVVRLTFTNGWVCTGTFVDQYTILTAAHCLTSEDAGQKIAIRLIESAADELVEVKQTGTYTQPKFQAQSWPAFDVGVLKTTKYTKFAHQFNIARKSPPTLGDAVLYGCGKTGLVGASRDRMMGENRFFRTLF